MLRLRSTPSSRQAAAGHRHRPRLQRRACCRAGARAAAGGRAGHRRCGGHPARQPLRGPGDQDAQAPVGHPATLHGVHAAPPTVPSYSVAAHWLRLRWLQESGCFCMRCKHRVASGMQPLTSVIPLLVRRRAVVGAGRPTARASPGSWGSWRRSMARRGRAWCWSTPSPIA